MLVRQIIEEAPGDWSVTVNGEFLGYARTEQQAEQKANAYAYNLLSRQSIVEEPIEDLFGATCQSSMTMTTVCPDCYGPTHAIFTYPNGQRVNYRQCDTDRTHARVRVS